MGDLDLFATESEGLKFNLLLFDYMIQNLAKLVTCQISPPCLTIISHFLTFFVWYVPLQGFFLPMQHEEWGRRKKAYTLMSKGEISYVFCETVQCATMRKTKLNSRLFPMRMSTISRWRCPYICKTESSWLDAKIEKSSSQLDFCESPVSLYWRNCP